MRDNQKFTRNVICAVPALCVLLFGCGGTAYTRDATNVRLLRAAAEEIPPCHLPPLSDVEVFAIAQEALGPDFNQPPGLAEPLRRIHEYRCLYIYEQSAYYVNGAPVSLDGVDTKFEIWIARDGSYLR